MNKAFLFFTAILLSGCIDSSRSEPDWMKVFSEYDCTDEQFAKAQRRATVIYEAQHSKVLAWYLSKQIEAICERRPQDDNR